MIEYYKFRVEGNLKIILKNDLISRTSELAKLFGIQFYEVLSRGSQVHKLTSWAFVFWMTNEFNQKFCSVSSRVDAFAHDQREGLCCSFPQYRSTWEVRAEKSAICTFHQTFNSFQFAVWQLQSASLLLWNPNQSSTLTRCWFWTFSHFIHLSSSPITIAIPLVLAKWSN